MKIVNSNETQPGHKSMISVIIPAYNEAKGIENTIRTVSEELEKIDITYETIVIDDGSIDDTYEILWHLSREFPSLKAIRFSRNFGKEAALLAGLKASRGDAIVTMDSDLQHPPGTIPLLIEKWRQGHKVVHAIKVKRDYDNIFVKLRALLFNHLFVLLGGIDLKNSSDFILLDRVAKDVLTKNFREKMRFYRGLSHWIGFKQTTVSFDVAQRWDKGKSRWSLISLYNLAANSLVAFTNLPLRIITILGFATLLIGLVIGVDALISYLLGKAVSGFATTIGVELIIGSFIMISLGIIGEYLAKIYEEVKARPTSLIEDSFGFKALTVNGRIKKNRGSFEVDPGMVGPVR